MHEEARLISRITRDRNMELPLRRGITADMFHDGEHRQAYQYLIRHSGKFDQVPSGTILRKEFPSLRLFAVEDSIEVVVDQFFKAYRKRLLWKMTDDCVDLVTSKVDRTDDIVALVRSTLDSLESKTSEMGSVNLAADPVRRFDEYKVRASRPNGVLGLPTGFPTIDRATLGLQPGQLVTIIATPKTGKSHLAMRIGANIQADGKVPAFVSFEMGIPELEKRYDSMAYGLNHTRLLNGSLMKFEEERYAEGLSNTMNDFHILDSTSGVTVSSLYAAVSPLRPDVLFVDGVYLMVDENSGESNTPQALTSITRSLKRLAQRMEIPIVITTQVLTWKIRKNRIDPNAIGYSSSFYQDSDTIFALEKEEDIDDIRTLRVVASRNTGLAQAELTWDWETGTFEEVGADSDSFSY